MMFGLGVGELVLIGVITVVVMGPKKIPELAKGLGQAIKEFNKSKTEVEIETKEKGS